MRIRNVQIFKDFAPFRGGEKKVRVKTLKRDKRELCSVFVLGLFQLGH